jgi:hypothetical protein
MHDAPLQIEVGDLGKVHPHVLVLAYDVSDRRRDLTVRQQARRHLIEQRVKQVVVSQIDQRDIDVLAPEPPGSRETTESFTSDHDPMTRIAV